MSKTRPIRLIESDQFPFEFISKLAERESWRKEVHRPIYHVHKWWAKRLGSVFRGILIGCAKEEGCNLVSDFERRHDFSNITILDPFMGSGTTIGESHKLGMTALGRDINPVAVRAVRTALGPLDPVRLKASLRELDSRVGEDLRQLYRTTDSHGNPATVLYYFWVMQANCPGCHDSVDLFSSRVVAKNAYPDRKPEIQALCPDCGFIFKADGRDARLACSNCHSVFDPASGVAKGARATCSRCQSQFKIIDALNRTKPKFRLYAKLVLTAAGDKEYLTANGDDLDAYIAASARLKEELHKKSIKLPSLNLEGGYNTRQALAYGFANWQDFFNDRQLLALGLLQRGILSIKDEDCREALLTLFSGTLEFNNMFASYKGEGTGAVRHMFSHHILKPEKTPIEANVWGTSKSSGSFTNLFKGRLLQASNYRIAPTDLRNATSEKAITSSPFSGRVEEEWPTNGNFKTRGIYVSCGDSAQSGLADRSIDYVVTDPPFFDNVHYSELADFFHAWHSSIREVETRSTRQAGEVQDTDPNRFGEKLTDVFQECHRILKDEGLLVFSYHHSRDDGWIPVAEAIYNSGFEVVNSHPVKSEMSVATPKAQAKEPIQIDIILVCRKRIPTEDNKESRFVPLTAAKNQVLRLLKAGFNLSRNDLRVILFGQLLRSDIPAADLATKALEIEELSAIHFERHDEPCIETTSQQEAFKW